MVFGKINALRQTTNIGAVRNPSTNHGQDASPGVLERHIKGSSVVRVPVQVVGGVPGPPIQIGSN